MSVLTANESLVSFFNQVQEPAEVRDSKGNLLGFYTPMKRVLSPGLNSEKRYTTKEVFEYLKTLTTDPVRLEDLQKHIEEIDARDKEQ